MRWLLLLLLCGCPESIRVGTDAGRINDASTGRDAGDAGDAGMTPDSGSDAGESIDAGDAGVPQNCTTSFMNRVTVPSPAGAGRFFAVRGLDFDPQGNLYVLSMAGPPFEGYVTVVGPGPSFPFLRTYGRGEMGLVRDIAVAPDGSSYVIQFDRNNFEIPKLHRFDTSGTLLSTIEVTEPNMNNDEAWSLDVDDSNTLYLGGFVLFRYGTDGTYQDFFGQFGMGQGQVLRPAGVAWDPRGFLWVADLFRNTVHQYDLISGDQVFEFGGRGSGLGTFDEGAMDGVYYGPNRIVVDGAGNLIVNDPWRSRLQRLGRLGEGLSEFSFGGSQEVGSLAVDPNTGYIFVARANGVDVVCPF